MDALFRRPALGAVALAVALASILGGQAAGDAMLERSAESSPAGSIQRAGFAYLTGIRTFAAAVLWNRLDPVYHDYYHDKPLVEQAQMLPTIKMVTTLDPEFVDAYYVGAWILAQRGLTDAALELAEDGVRDNPDSGLLRTSHAQVLYLVARDREAAFEQAHAAFSGHVEWRDAIEQHDSYAIIRGIFDGTGHHDLAEEVLVEIEHLDEVIGEDLPAGSHDHDGDGVPDH